MLSFFPQLLFLTPLAITLLRITAAIAFAVIAYHLIDTEEEITATRVPWFGKIQPWMVWLSSTIIAAVSILLFVGYATQIVAILGALAVLKHLIFYRKYRTILPLSSGTYAFLLVVCLALIVAGAGAFAFDLPL